MQKSGGLNGFNPVCYRCMETFRGAKGLAKHQETFCLKQLGDREDYTLPKPPKGATKSFIRFNNFQQIHSVPVVVYADFETYQRQIEGDVQRGAKTLVRSEMQGVASYGYYVESKIPGFSPAFTMQRQPAEAFLKEMLNIAAQYHERRNSPHPIVCLLYTSPSPRD